MHSELTPSMKGSIVLTCVEGVIAPYEPDEAEEPRGMPIVLISVQLKDLTKAPSVEEFKKWLTTHRTSMILNAFVSLKLKMCGPARQLLRRRRNQGDERPASAKGGKTYAGGAKIIWRWHEEEA
jgi:hypothetical protein